MAKVGWQDHSGFQTSNPLSVIEVLHPVIYIHTLSSSSLTSKHTLIFFYNFWDLQHRLRSSSPERASLQSIMVDLETEISTREKRQQIGFSMDLRWVHPVTDSLPYLWTLDLRQQASDPCRTRTKAPSACSSGSDPYRSMENRCIRENAWTRSDLI